MKRLLLLSSLAAAGALAIRAAKTLPAEEARRRCATSFMKKCEKEQRRKLATLKQPTRSCRARRKLASPRSASRMRPALNGCQAVRLVEACYPELLRGSSAVCECETVCAAVLNLRVSFDSLKRRSKLALSRKS